MPLVLVLYSPYQRGHAELFLKGVENMDFHLTQKAIHHAQHNMGVFVKFLICSIIVPMAVSLATSLIVLCIQGLL